MMSKQCPACGAENDDRRIVCHACQTEIERMPGRSYLDLLDPMHAGVADGPLKVEEFAIAPFQESGLTEANYTLTLRNEHTFMTAYTLDVVGERGSLLYELEPRRVTLAAGTAACVHLKVRTPLRLVGGIQMHKFTVESRLAGAETPRVVSGVFVQQPLLRSARPIMAAAISILTIGSLLVSQHSQLNKAIAGAISQNPISRGLSHAGEFTKFVQDNRKRAATGGRSGRKAHRISAARHHHLPRFTSATVTQLGVANADSWSRR